MDFYELNKKMNDSEYQCNEAEMTLKAHGGDRAKNLYGIADEIDSLTGPKSDPTAVFRTPELHKLKGYAEQLRIIADELRSGHLKGIADEIDSLTSGGRAVWRLPELHKLKGYVEQLKSIADELRSGE
jgi:hypothetical protein